MKFIHEDRDFGSLLQIIGRETGLGPALIEKDYWVTHTMWALHQMGLEVWFKGGTSLSKGFGLIRRFSEDLDLKIDRGTVTTLPQVENWKSKNKGPISEMCEFYRQLAEVILIQGAAVQVVQIDPRGRGARIQVLFSGQFTNDLPSSMRPYVLLEIGTARVTPFVQKPLSSYIHDYLHQHGQAHLYAANTPQSVRCLHPMVTLIDKLDAISRRFSRDEPEFPSFIRHYEDAACIIQAIEGLPPLAQGSSELLQAMIDEGDVKGPPCVDDPAFTLEGNPYRDQMEAGYLDIEPMFWGDRLPLEECCALIRAWLTD